MNWKAAIATVALSMAIVPAVSFAQNNGGGNNGGNRDRGGQGGAGGAPQGGATQGGDRGGNRGGGAWDPAEFQKRQLERVKEQLKAPDDEWKVIEPKLEKVFTAQREAFRGMGGFGGGGGRRGGGGGPGGGGGGDQPQDNSEIGVAQRELRTVLERDASGEDVDKKLAAYRAAREKAQKALDAARKDLKEVLSAKQEAQLVLGGTLD